MGRASAVMTPEGKRLLLAAGLAFAFMLALVWGWRWMRRHDDDFAPVEEADDASGFDADAEVVP